MCIKNVQTKFTLAVPFDAKLIDRYLCGLIPTHSASMRAFLSNFTSY